MMGLWLWLAQRIGVKWALVVVLAAVGVLGFGSFWTYVSIRHWWDARSLAHVTAQRDDALTRAANAETNVAHAEASADVAGQARHDNDQAIPAVRAASAARVARADHASDAERLSDDQAALAQYRAAANQLRGASPR